MRIKLLVTESDDALVVAYAEFFSRMGFRVETAGGGVECLEKVRRFQPDVLILDADLHWGGADGVLARMIQEERLPRVPVIMAAGRQSPSTLSRLFGLPSRRCFQKPLQMLCLLDEIESASGAPGRFALN